MRVNSKVLSAIAMIMLVALLCPVLAYAEDGAPGTDFTRGSSPTLEPTVSQLQTQGESIYSVTVDGIDDSVTYTGSDITFSLTVRNADGSYLWEDYDYTVRYESNKNVGTGYVVLTGVGDYQGSRWLSFSITPADITYASVTNVPTKTYTGSAITQNPTVRANGETLVEGVDYELDYRSNTDAGTATMFIRGKGNYTEYATEYFTISPAKIDDTTVTEIKDQLYRGYALEPIPTVKFNSKTLRRFTDFDCSYSDNVDPGKKTGKVTITGMGNYTGSRTVYFTIYGADISKADVYYVYDKTYDGTAQIQYPSVSFNGSYLTEGVDYTLSYSNNVNAGTASLIVSGIGVYSDTKYVSFEIDPEYIDEASISSVPNQLYTGNAITPSPTITFDGKQLTRGVDYTLSYENNTKPGYATITVTGIGNFRGTDYVDFYISQSNLAKARLSLPKKSFTYTGGSITPRPKVVYGGRTLSWGTDYTLEYVRNVNVGTGTVKVVGAGGYAGSAKMTFKITKAPFSKAKVKLASKSYSYKGKIITPKAVVTYKGYTLKAGRDYKITAKSAKNVGEHTAKVTGLRNFKGSVKKNFKINPQPSKITSLVSKRDRDGKTGTVELRWKKVVGGCTGYDVHISTSPSFNKRAGVIKKKFNIKEAAGKRCSFFGSGLTRYKTYYFKVRTYKTLGSKEYYSAWSAVRSVWTKY